MDRRSFIKKAGIAGSVGAAALATPAIAQGTKDLVIVSTWPRDFPGLGVSAQRLAARITELSEGKITTQYFAAGERVGAFDHGAKSGLKGNSLPDIAPPVITRRDLSFKKLPADGGIKCNVRFLELNIGKTTGQVFFNRIHIMAVIGHFHT